MLQPGRGGERKGGEERWADRERRERKCRDEEGQHLWTHWKPSITVSAIGYLELVSIKFQQNLMNSRRKNIPTVEEQKQEFPLPPCRNPKPNIPNLRGSALGKAAPERGATEEPRRKYQQIAGGVRDQSDRNGNLKDLVFTTETSIRGGKDGGWLILP